MQLPDGVKMTPMMKQYTEWKDRYPDCLLLFRMGDFFEMFFDDAVTASKVLDIALTARDADKAIPMAGVPHHALDAYLGKLIRAGFKAAVCDQITEPDGRTLVDRKVVRVITPGTFTPQNSDDDGRLAAFICDGDDASIALLTPSDGRLQAGTFPFDEAVSMIISFDPGELLIPKGQEASAARSFSNASPRLARQGAILQRDKQEFSTSIASRSLSERWSIASMRAMGMEDGDNAVGAAYAAIRYLEETQFQVGEHIHGIEPLHPSGMLIIDHTTQSNLELVGENATLFSTLDRCRTQTGKRLLRDQILHPIIDIDEISFRQNCVSDMLSDPSLINDLASALSKCRDMERALGRLSLNTGNPKDLAAIRDTLAAIPDIEDLLRSKCDTHISTIAASMPDTSSLRDLLSRALADDPPRSLSAGGVIREQYDAELDDLRDALKNTGEHLVEFEKYERERTGLKIKVGLNKVFGYYIEVPKSASEMVPDDYIRKQTVSNGERYINERLKEIERRAERAELETGEIEALLYKELVQAAIDAGRECQAASKVIAMVDMLRAFAELARDSRYTKPIVDTTRVFSIKGARHPVIERTLGSTAFTPNDIELDPDAGSGGCVAMITGPNMAGKSTYLRTAALIAIMAHIGSFVPADSAHIGRIDRIFTRIGARDELSRGRSTFMVEMVETANILRHVKDRSLVVLDEIGRGTSTYDGMSIAWAVLEFLCLHVEGRTKAMFATHYHELTQISLPMLVNLSMAVEETRDGVRFLHKVVRGPADRSYGIEVAKLAGVPSLVVKRAQELLAQLEEKRSGATDDIASMSKKYAQKEIFFDVEREGLLEQLAKCDPDNMTPMEALDMISKLRRKSRKVLGLE